MKAPAHERITPASLLVDLLATVAFIVPFRLRAWWNW